MGYDVYIDFIDWIEPDMELVIRVTIGSSSAEVRRHNKAQKEYELRRFLG